MKGTFYFLDFDGTVSPIVKNPLMAQLPKKAEKLIRTLSSEKGSKVAIVTGRAFGDIFEKVGLKNIFYAANHGLEIYKGRRRLLVKCEGLKKAIQTVSKEVHRIASGFEGVVVQEKGLSLSIHFRMVPPGQRAVLARKVRSAIKDILKNHGLDIHGGKMLIEIRPRSKWNKGDAVRWLCERYGTGLTPFYIGDDITDEDAFMAVRGSGIAARIRYRKGTNASHILKRPLY